MVAVLSRRIANAPRLLFVRPRAADEVAYLLYLARNAERYAALGYSLTLPCQAGVIAAITAAMDNDAMRLEAIRLFRKSTYRAADYAAGLDALEHCRVRVEGACARLAEMDIQPGFRVFPRYRVMLTLYGMGGSYDAARGGIVVKTTADGKFVRRDPAAVLLHEILHIGLEECVMQRFHLKHAQKEGVVDGLCLSVFGDVLPDYEPSKKADQQIVRLVASKSPAEVSATIAKLFKRPRGEVV